MCIWEDTFKALHQLFRIIRRITGDLSCLYFIHKEIVHIFEREVIDFFIHRRGIQHDCHPRFMRFLNDILQIVDFILKDDPVPLFKMAKSLIHLFLRHRLIRTTEQNDAVVSVIRVLYDRVSNRYVIQASDKIRIHTCIP